MRTTLLVALSWCSLGAQAPAALENTGKPMSLPGQCSQDDIRSFGLTCPPQQPCPLYLELSGLEPLGNKIFVAGNIHTESATLWSVLLATEDGGKTWSEPHSRIEAAGLEQIQFFDLQAGWVSGHQLHALPRDPFLLLTTDGGKSWRARPVYTESRVGTIDRFWFDSKTHGMIWINRTQAGEPGSRYEMWETMTGGESWMVREVSDRPILTDQAKVRPPSPDWRLRVDAPSKSYRIEKRAGERWQTLASFLIGVGECKEAEVALPEPPTP
jgi:hypothetical protein